MMNFPEVSTDPLERARRLERIHAATLSESDEEETPRPVVAASWQRSLQARIDPNGWQPPIVFAADELEEQRDAHSLASCLPLLRRTLLDEVGECAHIMIVTDETGHILWREGHPSVCRKADDVLLSEGTRWAEETIGTNAMGTTLATGTPVQIHSAEHLVCTYHSWTCAASPIRDPETGEVIGSIDLSGPLHTMHPTLPALVAAASRLAEGELAEQMRRRHMRIVEREMPRLRPSSGESVALLSPYGRVIASEPRNLALPEGAVPRTCGEEFDAGNGRKAVLEPLTEGYLLRTYRVSGVKQRDSVLRLRFTGTWPEVELNDRSVRVGQRHAELLAALTLRPEGLNAEQLALMVHGEQGNPVTVRAELHRLRARLGNSIVRTKPYRLGVRVEADFTAVRSLLREGRPAAALERYGQGLLPGSDAPVVRAERDELLAGMRAAVLAARDPELLWRFAHTDSGRWDAEVLEQLLETLPVRDWRRAGTRTRLDRLLNDEE
ncbi:GAF domain-containing protein [Actinopolyspora sp. BKK1]|nr:GAF domain-containing protein [Actinopolyspora sp. BKK2]NHE75998.1 GAF domain-containing protein [Actinopolyspora sp. BKK1]